MSRPQIDYIGRTYGVVTVTKREGRRLLCECKCGAVRYLHAANLISHPPKGHSRCRPNFQYELPLDRA